MLRGMPYPPPPLLPAAAMARRLRVRADWLTAEADAERLPHVRAGDRYLFDPVAVERELLERAQRPDGREAGDAR